MGFTQSGLYRKSCRFRRLAEDGILNHEAVLGNAITIGLDLPLASYTIGSTLTASTVKATVTARMEITCVGRRTTTCHAGYLFTSQPQPSCVPTYSPTARTTTMKDTLTDAVCTTEDKGSRTLLSVPAVATGLGTTLTTANTDSTRLLLTSFTGQREGYLLSQTPTFSRPTATTASHGLSPAFLTYRSL